MAEYWKSTVSTTLNSDLEHHINLRTLIQPKYWCKHCGIYVRDTPFERTQHEATGKHQGALKRFLRDIHRNKEQEERESNKAKSEVERLKGLVSGSGPDRQQQPPWKRLGGASTGGASVSRSANVESRKRQMAQLAEMGVAIPEEFRPEMALAGEWKEVAKEETPKTLETADSPAATAVGVRKRKIDDRGEEEVEQGAPRKVWGSTIRRYPGASGGDDEDLDALLEMTTELKRKKSIKTEIKAEAEDTPIKREEEQTPVKQTPSGGKDHPAVKKEPEDVKAEEETKEPNLAAIPEATDAPADAPAVVFKKRKPKQIKR